MTEAAWARALRSNSAYALSPAGFLRRPGWCGEGSRRGREVGTVRYEVVWRGGVLGVAARILRLISGPDRLVNGLHRLIDGLN